MSESLERIYDYRFARGVREVREQVWVCLCRQFFQDFVGPEAVVLDLACGFGEFSRNIRARRRIAVDSKRDRAWDESSGVEYFESEADDLHFLSTSSVDVCFTSNFFEHLPSKRAMDRVLSEVLRVLRPGGRFVVLQPNIKYASREYWDFYDHHLPLSHLSAAEGFVGAGYEIEKLIPRFLPWSFSSRIPKNRFLVSLYLKLPVTWSILGKQFLLVAKKPETGS